MKASSAVNILSGDLLGVAPSVKRSLSANTLADDKTTFDSAFKASQSDLSSEVSETVDEVPASPVDLAADGEAESGGIFSKMKEFVRKSQENLLSIVSDKPKTTPEVR